MNVTTSHYAREWTAALSIYYVEHSQEATLLQILKRRIPTPEEQSAELRQAQKRAEVAEAEYSLALREIGRARRIEVNPYTPTEDQRETVRQKNAALDEGVKKRDKAKAEMADLRPQIMRLHSEACRAICADLAPDYGRNLRSFYRSKLERHADEIAALAALVEVRRELDAKQIKRGTLAWSESLGAAEEEFAGLRAEVVELLDSGALKKADVPNPVRGAWGL